MPLINVQQMTVLKVYITNKDGLFLLVLHCNSTTINLKY